MRERVESEEGFFDLVVLCVRLNSKGDIMSEKFNLAAETAALYGYELPKASPASVLHQVLIHPGVAADYEVRTQLEDAIGQINEGNRTEAIQTLEAALSLQGMNALAGDQAAHETVKEVIQQLDTKSQNSAPFNLAEEQHKLWFKEEQ